MYCNLIPSSLFSSAHQGTKREGLVKNYWTSETMNVRREKGSSFIASWIKGLSAGALTRLSNEWSANQSKKMSRSKADRPEAGSAKLDCREPRKSSSRKMAQLACSNTGRHEAALADSARREPRGLSSHKVAQTTLLIPATPLRPACAGQR